MPSSLLTQGLCSCFLSKHPLGTSGVIMGDAFTPQSSLCPEQLLPVTPQSSSTESLDVASSPSQSSCQLVLLAGEKEGGRQSKTQQEGFGWLLEAPGLNQSWNTDVAGAWLKQRVNTHVKPLFIFFFHSSQCTFFIFYFLFLTLASRTVPDMFCDFSPFPLQMSKRILRTEMFGETAFAIVHARS